MEWGAPVPQPETPRPAVLGFDTIVWVWKRGYYRVAMMFLAYDGLIVEGPERIRPHQVLGETVERLAAAYREAGFTVTCDELSC